MANDGEARKRATVHDLARQAGVSLATVDRVLNRRPGVRPATVEKVEKAIAALDFHRDITASLLARSRDIRVEVIMPAGENRFMARLARAFADEAGRRSAERMSIAVSRLRALDGATMARAIAGLDPESCDCAIVVAADTAAVREAVGVASAARIAVLTLVSDLPGSARRLFVGIDNLAAGRTAASLMGRFCPEGGKIGLVAGSLDLRDHRQRYEGFVEVARREFPSLHLVGPVEGNDEAAGTAAAVSSLIADHPDLIGLYCMGAGNAGLVSALHETGRAGRLRVIGHEVTDVSARALRDGTFDVLIDQNPEGEARAALDAARAIVLGPGAAPADISIEIGIFLRDNLL